MAKTHFKICFLIHLSNGIVYNSIYHSFIDHYNYIKQMESEGLITCSEDFTNGVQIEERNAVDLFTVTDKGQLFLDNVIPFYKEEQYVK